MEKRRNVRRRDYKDNPVNQQKVQIQKIMQKYNMDEAAALEIMYGISSIESWLEKEDRNDYIGEMIAERISCFSNKAHFSAQGAVQILKGIYGMADYYQEEKSILSKRDQADALQKDYEIPAEIARRIVRGDFTINDYLAEEQMLEKRRQKAMAIYQKYPEIALNTCYQIVDEKISVEDFFKRRELRRHRREEWYIHFLKEHEDDNYRLACYLQKLRNKKIKTMFSFFSRNPIMGIVSSYTPYSIKIKTKLGVQMYSKLDMKYMTRSLYAERFLSQIEIDRELQKNCMKPDSDPAKRYQIPDQLLREGNTICLTLGSGEICHGIIDWFSRYDMKILIREEPKASVLIFRHAVVAAS